MRPTTHPTTSAAPVARSLFALALATMASMAGCSTPPKDESGKLRISDAQQSAADKEFLRQPFDDQVAAGVLRQRTIFEHEFEPGSAKLTALGKRDVRILSSALREDGGSISVRRGSAPEALYAARRETVRKALVAEGIAADRVQLDEAASGGAGTSSGEALRIRERIQRGPMQPPPKDILSPTGGSNP